MCGSATHLTLDSAICFHFNNDDDDDDDDDDDEVVVSIEVNETSVLCLSDWGHGFIFIVRNLNLTITMTCNS